MPTQIFVSYSHLDESLYDRLAKHLKPLEYEGLIEVWHDRRIAPGVAWADEINRELESSGIVLLLISADFIASDYCWGKEMKRAIERHEDGLARVVPIILRPVDWQRSPFGKLMALPRDGKPVTSWIDVDEAFLNVAQSIRAMTQCPDMPPLTPSEKVSPSKPSFLNESSLNSLFSLTYPRLGTLKDGFVRMEFKVLVDGVKTAEIHTGETIDFSVVPGLHHIQVQRFFAKSKVLVLSTSPNERVELELRWVLFDDTADLSARALSVYGVGEVISLKRKS